MLVITGLFLYQLLSLNYLSITFYPTFHHLLMLLTISLVLSRNMD